ncbi:unnamed protein product [Effrenium voratum]|nr:unnamed protein product [Effrenium voratum]
MPWRSKLTRLQVLSEWQTSRRRRPRCKDLKKRAAAADTGETEQIDDITRMDEENDPRPETQEPRPPARPCPRSPLLKAMDAPRFSIKSRSSKRQLLMQLALLPPTGARAKVKPTPPGGPPPKAAAKAPTKTRDASFEIQRILGAASAEEKLQISGEATEEAISKVWKKLVLLLHPDKLQSLDDDTKAKGAEALHEVHAAKEELRQRAQQACAQVPVPPTRGSAPRCLNATPGARKYEISWMLPEVQDPKAPIEKYEVWGPRYCSEPGETFDWVLLATLPPLQSQFIIVEEAPTQQDVMWAADRVLRPTMSLAVYAVNGKGPSEALSLELPWASAFPWLRGVGSLLCGKCFKLTPRGARQAWTACAGCGVGLAAELAIVVRCTGCGGEVLWQHNALSCTSCRKSFGHNMPSRRSHGQDGHDRYHGARAW